MGELIIVDKDFDHSKCTPAEALPAFYMEDFSVVALRAKPLKQAIDLLQKNRFKTVQAGAMQKVKIAAAGDVLKIRNLLQSGGVDVDYTDLVDQVYQG